MEGTGRVVSTTRPGSAEQSAVAAPLPVARIDNLPWPAIKCIAQCLPENDVLALSGASAALREQLSDHHTAALIKSRIDELAGNCTSEKMQGMVTISAQIPSVRSLSLRASLQRQFSEHLRKLLWEIPSLTHQYGPRALEPCVGLVAARPEGTQRSEALGHFYAGISRLHEREWNNLMVARYGLDPEGFTGQLERANTLLDRMAPLRRAMVLLHAVHAASPVLDKGEQLFLLKLSAHVRSGLPEHHDAIAVLDFSDNICRLRFESGATPVFTRTLEILPALPQEAHRLALRTLAKWPQLVLHAEQFPAYLDALGKLVLSASTSDARLILRDLAFNYLRVLNDDEQGVVCPGKELEEAMHAWGSKFEERGRISLIKFLVEELPGSTVGETSIRRLAATLAPRQRESLLAKMDDVSRPI